MISVKINYNPSIINHFAVLHPCGICLPATPAAFPSALLGSRPSPPAGGSNIHSLRGGTEYRAGASGTCETGKHIALGIGFVAINYVTAPIPNQAGIFMYGVNKNIKRFF